MAKQNIFKKFKNDTVFRNRFTLTFSFCWGLLLAIYYAIIGFVATKQTSSWTWSWFLSLSIWYLVIIVFKALLMANAFRIKKDKWIDFKLMTIVYMFINFFELLILTIYPSFLTTTFGEKLNAGITISSLIVSDVNIVLFILNFVSVKREQFTRNEADFIQSKKYIGRTEGIFNIMIIVINILMLCSVSQNVIAWIYFGIGIIFEILSLYIAIKLIKKRKWDKAHKN